MKSTLLKGAYLVTMREGEQPFRGDLLMRGDKIEPPRWRCLQTKSLTPGTWRPCQV